MYIYISNCREFKEYVICTDPLVQGCDSVLMTDYIDSKEIYTQEPYNCQLPNIVHLVRSKPLTSDSTSLHWQRTLALGHLYKLLVMALGLFSYNIDLVS